VFLINPHLVGLYLCILRNKKYKKPPEENLRELLHPILVSRSTVTVDRFGSCRLTRNFNEKWQILNTPDQTLISIIEIADCCLYVQTKVSRPKKQHRACIPGSNQVTFQRSIGLDGVRHVRTVQCKHKLKLAHVSLHYVA
jgi:hypothetical protein